METYNKWHTETKYFNYYANLILYCLVFLPVLSLKGVRELVGDTIYSALQSAAAVILGLMVIFKARRLRWDSFVVLYMVVQGIIFAGTVLHYGFSMGILVAICAGIFLVLLMQKDAEIIVRALAIVSLLSLIINLGYMAVLGADERTVYFIGGKNAFSIFLVPAMFFVMVNALIRKGRITRSAILFAVLAVGTILWGRSGTGTVTVAAMIVMLLWVRKNKPNPTVWLIAMFAMHIILVFFLEALSGTSLWSSIMDLLGKDDTLTSRVAIWEKVLTIVKGNWLFGVGRGTQIVYTSRWGYTTIAAEAHNFFLELLLEGGLVGFCLYAVMIWSTVKRMNMDSMLNRLAFCGFMVMMVNGLAEAINNQMVVNIILALMYACSNKVICEKNYGH